MQKSILIKEGKIINKGKIFEGDIFIKNGRIELIGKDIDKKADKEINAFGKYVIPGVIDDHVHFREPGVTYKADIFSEAKAAIAGGVTSFMEMPNTNPGTLTQKLLEEKYSIAAKTSLANYSFYMGVSNDNLEEVLKTNPKNVCGVKVFLGASTGDLLVDDINTLEGLFSKSEMLISVHSEEENTIRFNLSYYKEKYGQDVPIEKHPEIRTPEGCYISSRLAIGLAKKYDTRLHILHLSTENEMDLFKNNIPLQEKKITAEVCVHHLYFNSDDYAEKGNLIKCNPAIKSKKHQDALFEALLDDKLDVIATDHAPHTWEEKQKKYLEAPSGVPLVQHSLNVMLEFYNRGKISLEKIVEKMCHAPAECFKIEKRGYIEEGFWADIVILDLEKEWQVTKENILYKCGWSPFEGHSFKGKVETTIVNGNIVLDNGVFYKDIMGQRLLFCH